MRGGHSLRAPVPHAGRPRSSGSRPPVRHTAARAAGRRCLAGPTPVAPSRDLPASACARSTLTPASACSTVALRERPPRVCRGVLTCERSVPRTSERRSGRGVASRRIVPERETRTPSTSAWRPLVWYRELGRPEAPAGASGRRSAGAPFDRRQAGRCRVAGGRRALAQDAGATRGGRSWSATWSTPTPATA